MAPGGAGAEQHDDAAAEGGAPRGVDEAVRAREAEGGDGGAAGWAAAVPTTPSTSTSTVRRSSAAPVSMF